MAVLEQRKVDEVLVLRVRGALDHQGVPSIRQPCRHCSAQAFEFVRARVRDGEDRTRLRVPEEGALTAVYSFHTLTAGTFPVGPFRVTVERVSHPVETYGVRVDHAGASLALDIVTGQGIERLRLGPDLTSGKRPQGVWRHP